MEINLNFLNLIISLYIAKYITNLIINGISFKFCESDGGQINMWSVDRNVYIRFGLVFLARKKVLKWDLMQDADDKECQ